MRVRRTSSRWPLRVAASGGLALVALLAVRAWSHAWPDRRTRAPRPTDTVEAPEPASAAREATAFRSPPPAPLPALGSRASLPAVAAPPAPPPWYAGDGGPHAFDELLDHWHDESPDREWSSNVTSFIYALLETNELQHEVIRNVDCRETLCRIQLEGSQMDTLIRLNTTLTNDDHYRYSQRFSEEEDGGTLVEVISRETRSWSACSRTEASLY